MDRSAHHRVRSASEARASLSAAERAGLKWGFERVLQQHAAACGERHDLARTLQRALRPLPVVMLHDRRLPDGALVEHLAVGPGGVTVVAGWDAAELVEPLTVEHLHGVFGARADLLRDGTAADRTALVAPLRALVVTVRTAIDEMAPVAAGLCLDGDAGLTRIRPLFVDDVLVGGPKAIAELAARDGDLHDY